MKYFYAVLLWLTQYELAIARSTGRNPANVAALQGEEQTWAKCLWELDVNY